MCNKSARRDKSAFSLFLLFVRDVARRSLPPVDGRQATGVYTTLVFLPILLSSSAGFFLPTLAFLYSYLNFSFFSQTSCCRLLPFYLFTFCLPYCWPASIRLRLPHLGELRHEVLPQEHVRHTRGPQRGLRALPISSATSFFKRTLPICSAAFTFSGRGKAEEVKEPNFLHTPISV